MAGKTTAHPVRLTQDGREDRAPFKFMGEDVRVGGIHQNGTNHFIGIEAIEDAHVESPVSSPAHQHVGRWNRRGEQERMKIIGDDLKCPRRRAGVAPAVAGAVIPAGTSELRDFRLDVDPREPAVWPGGSKTTVGPPSPEQKMFSLRPPISTDCPICGYRARSCRSPIFS
jgi:hypothetical protein